MADCLQKQILSPSERNVVNKIVEKLWSEGENADASENKRALSCKEWVGGVSWRSSESHTHVFEDRMGIDSDGALT